jgi:hypothetical protein
MRHAIRRLREELRILRDVQRQIEADTTVEPDNIRRQALLAEIALECRQVRDAVRVLQAMQNAADGIEPGGRAPSLPFTTETANAADHL